VIDKSKGEIARFLQQHKVAHLALSGLDGPWASVVHFMNAGLMLYLIEPRAGDLVFYVENDPHIALTVGEKTVDHTGENVQMFGRARVLPSSDLQGTPDGVQAAYVSKERETPGVYVVIEVKPRQIHRLMYREGAIRRETIDVDLLNHKEYARQKPTNNKISDKPERRQAKN
jgi:nitroimidazol reductase NimA-like FMN-containing flavoprotein (pyridoxamine 5'-phosphate oxidase superfamily)